MPVNQRGNGYQASLITDGQRIRRQFATEAEANAWLMESQAKLLRGESIDRGDSVTTGRTWEELRRATHSRYWHGSKGEHTAFINSARAVRHFGAEDYVSNLNAEDVDKYVQILENEGNSNATINRKLAALSKMLRFALERDWITKVPAMHRKKEYEGRIRFLSKEEETLMLKTLEHLGFGFYAKLCVFLIDTGARVGEALSFEWKDLNNDKATFWDTKSGKARTVPLTKRAQELLASLPRDGKGPFDTVNQSSFNKVWNRMKNMMRLGDDAQFVPHALRHTCASRLVQAGVPLLTVKEFLGHKSIQVTLRYAHLLPQNLMDATKKLEEYEYAKAIN
jgi:integrase